MPACMILLVFQIVQGEVSVIQTKVNIHRSINPNEVIQLVGMVDQTNIPKFRGHTTICPSTPRNCNFSKSDVTRVPFFLFSSSADESVLCSTVSLHSCIPFQFPPFDFILCSS